MASSKRMFSVSSRKRLKPTRRNTTPRSDVAPAAPRLAHCGNASSTSVATRDTAANMNIRTSSPARSGRNASESAPKVQATTAATMQAVSTRHTADGVMQGSGYASRIACSVDASMSGKDEHERAQPQDRGEKEGETAHVVPKRLEQKPQEPDIDGNDSLGEIEGATEREGEPHDQAGHDEESGEPDPPVQLAAEDAGDEPAQEQEEPRIGEDLLEVGLALEPDGERRGRHAESAEHDGVDTQVAHVDRRERPLDQADGDAPPCGQRGQGEAEDRPRVPQVGAEEIDHPDDEEMVRPLGPEQGEFHLDVREVRGEEEEAQEKDVVEGHVRGGDRSPREGGRVANHPDQAGDCREGDRARDGPRPDVLAVFLDEEPDSRREEENARVAKRPDLEAGGDEAPSRDAVEEGRLRLPEDIVSTQAGDRAHDVGVHVPAEPAVLGEGQGSAAMGHGATAAGRESTNVSTLFPVEFLRLGRDPGPEEAKRANGQDRLCGRDVACAGSRIL